MKATKISFVCLFGLIFMMAISHQGVQGESDKPTFRWLSTPHQAVTNPDGVVRSRGHALALGKVAMKYLFDADENVDVELVGSYWIAYTKALKMSSAPRVHERYFVKINRVNGGVEEYGYYPGN